LAIRVRKQAGLSRSRLLCPKALSLALLFPRRAPRRLPETERFAAEQKAAAWTAAQVAARGRLYRERRGQIRTMRGDRASCRDHDWSSGTNTRSTAGSSSAAAAGTVDECPAPTGAVQSGRLVADTSSSRRRDAAEAAACADSAPADRPPPLPSAALRPRPYPGMCSYPLAEAAASALTEDTPCTCFKLDPQGAETLSALRKRATYYIPILGWLPSYSAQCLAHDVVAGVTVACLIIPQSLSYASSLVKLDPVYGLYCAFVPGIVYAVLGTSRCVPLSVLCRALVRRSWSVLTVRGRWELYARQLSVGADALISMLVGAAVSQQLENTPVGINENVVAADPAVYASILGAFVGMFLLVLGLMRLGFLDSVLSRALLRGFICAVACVIVIEQTIPCLGLDRLPNKPSHGASPLAKAAFVVESAGSAHALTSAVSFGTIAFLISATHIKKLLAKLHPAILLVPEMLVAVIVSSGLSGALCWHTYGLEILGDTGSGRFPWPKAPAMPPFAHIQKLMGSAALIAVIGFVESVVIAKHYAAAHNYPVSPNREL
ncbi:MAG: sulfate transporter family-domain-containing protein, partial [Olpidium bornovanus]